MDIGGLQSHKSHENINLIGTSILRDAKNKDFHILGFVYRCVGSPLGRLVYRPFVSQAFIAGHPHADEHHAIPVGELGAPSSRGENMAIILVVS